MSDNQTTQPRLEVERDGWKVTLTFRCANSYDALRLYDQVLEGARSGPVLRIDVEIANG
jgi:hypothetical protein